MIVSLCSKDDFTENSMLEIVHEGHSYLVAKVEDEFYFMVIRDGVIDDFYQGTTGLDAYTINVGGHLKVWDKMMELPPQPFYHDWFAASFHHEFELGGDLQSAYAYYYALKRIHVCMAQCVNTTKFAA